MRRVHVEQLAGTAIGSLDDNFVIVEWTAEVGDHWIAPLHVHDEDDEAWYVLSGALGFRLGDEEVESTRGLGCPRSTRHGSYVLERRPPRSSVPASDDTAHCTAGRGDP